MISTRLFHKLVWSRGAGVDVEAGGFPNLQFCSSSSVEGVLYLLKEQEVKLIDSNMGYPEVRTRQIVDFRFCRCCEVKSSLCFVLLSV